MARRCFLKYPCGKLFEIKVPIRVDNIGENEYYVLPGTDEYFYQATKKFSINNLEVIEQELPEQSINQSTDFISLYNRIRSIE